jgi:acyl-CoA synthetase (AMP-forming)/AMP-acid ligase II
MPLFWAIHQLEGVVAPANPSYSADELRHQLLDSKAKALFTCVSLLPAALEAAAKAGFSKNQIYLIDVPQQILGNTKPPSELKSVSQIAEAGKSLPPVQPVQWGHGEAARRTAFLCYSSGTSGLPVSLDFLNRCNNWKWTI